VNERIETRSAEETQAFAARLAKKLQPGAVLALYGELGAGKTCFTQGLAYGLGVVQAVNSPTFTIINEYKADIPLYHIDLYRIHSEDEALDLGLDNYLYSDGITVIEWSERVESLLPKSTIHVRFEMGGGHNERRIRVEGLECWNDGMLE